ncbi:MAG: stalk domain-containing protein [Cellulosilyticaceae bacterium]
MKLRQKLAMVLAAAMLVTAVPVTTMAASTNSFNKTISIVKDSVLDTTTNLTLDFAIDKIDANATAADRTFFVNVTDFEFDADLYTAANTPGVQVTILKNGKQAKVVIDADAAITANNKVSFPVFGQVKGEMPTLAVDGYDSLVNSGEYIIGSGESVTDKALKVVAGDQGKISIEGYGEIGTIVIQEVVAGSSKEQVIKVELPRKSDVIFADTQEVTATGDRGLAGLLEGNATAVVAEDGRSMEITLPAHKAGATRGSVELTGIKVEPKDPRKDCAEGAVDVTVKGDKVADTTITVGQIMASGIAIKTTKDFALEAGRATKELEIEIKENSIDTLSGRNLYVNIEGAKFVATEGLTITEDGELVIKPSTNDNALDTVKVKVNVHADANTEGEIKLTVEGRDLEEKQEHVAGKVTKPFTVDAKGMTVKVGLAGQIDKDSNIVITEAEAGKFEVGQQIVLDLGTKYNLDITAAKVEVKGGLVFKQEIDEENNKLVLTVKEESEKDEPSTITIKDIKVDVDRTVPEGKLDAVLYGTAICSEYVDVAGKDNDHIDGITLKDFVVIGTKNTEDNGNDLVSGTAAFKAGEKSFMHNEEEKAMDVAAYISEKNYMMIPVRYLSEAFGVAADKIKFDQPTGTVTMFIGEKVVQLTNGSNIVLVNGVKVPMQEKMTIKDDRAFAPMGEIARVLGVDVEWNNETKTATFTN